MRKAEAERTLRAIAESQYSGAVADWFSEPEEEGPRRSALADRLTYWRSVLDVLNWTGQTAQAGR